VQLGVYSPSSRPGAHPVARWPGSPTAAPQGRGPGRAPGPLRHARPATRFQRARNRPEGRRTGPPPRLVPAAQVRHSAHALAATRLVRPACPGSVGAAAGSILKPGRPFAVPAQQVPSRESAFRGLSASPRHPAPFFALVAVLAALPGPSRSRHGPGPRRGTFLPPSLRVHVHVPHKPHPRHVALQGNFPRRARATLLTARARSRSKDGPGSEVGRNPAHSPQTKVLVPARPVPAPRRTAPASGFARRAPLRCGVRVGPAPSHLSRYSIGSATWSRYRPPVTNRESIASDQRLPFQGTSAGPGTALQI